MTKPDASLVHDHRHRLSRHGQQSHHVDKPTPLPRHTHNPVQVQCMHVHLVADRRGVPQHPPSGRNVQLRRRHCAVDKAVDAVHERRLGNLVLVRHGGHASGGRAGPLVRDRVLAGGGKGAHRLVHNVQKRKDVVRVRGAPVRVEGHARGGDNQRAVQASVQMGRVDAAAVDEDPGRHHVRRRGAVAGHRRRFRRHVKHPRGLLPRRDRRRVGCRRHQLAHFPRYGKRKRVTHDDLEALPCRHVQRRAEGAHLGGRRHRRRPAGRDVARPAPLDVRVANESRRRADEQGLAVRVGVARALVDVRAVSGGGEAVHVGRQEDGSGGGGEGRGGEGAARGRGGSGAPQGDDGGGGGSRRHQQGRHLAGEAAACRPAGAASAPHGWR